MFSIGEFVVYGNKGVCEVRKIGPIDIPGMSADRETRRILPGGVFEETE